MISIAEICLLQGFEERGPQRLVGIHSISLEVCLDQCYCWRYSDGQRRTAIDVLAGCDGIYVHPLIMPSFSRREFFTSSAALYYQDDS